MTVRSRLVAVVLIALTAIGVVVLPATGGAPAAVAQAADTSKFQAGNIITDQLFFNGSAMSAAAVQTFLGVQNPNCVAGPMPCLKDYRQTTATRAASAYCPGTYVGATSEPASTIIAKVGLACGISQRVLLVILQKEEGLVTASGSGLSATRYQSAMGFGCPDTAACSSLYYGFFNQVYSAAAQYRRYAANPGSYSHHAGMTNNVRFSPNSACGSSPVYIVNQATAGLYNYTPYQPNAAALAAGAGTGDGCSAYGNRNFWIYFTNWFGSTQTAGAGDLVDKYMATGGSGGRLGAVTNPVTCGLQGGGCFQGYTNGAIYWSPTTGARAVYSGPVRDKWAALSWERGGLGYPISDAAQTSTGGWFEHFQNGSIYWSTATGAHTVAGAVRDRWASLSWERGPLGYPAADQGTTPDGTAQFAHFQNGSIYASTATGAHVVSGAVRSEWASLGWERSPLGLPLVDVQNTPDGQAQFAHFQGGSIYVVGGSPRVLSSAVVAAWQRTGWERGILGYPASDTLTTAGTPGQVMSFQHGAVYVGADGVGHALAAPLNDAFGAAGGTSGSLGLPTTDGATSADGRAVFAHFQGGALYLVDGVPRVLPDAVDAAWRAVGGSSGVLGYPAADVVQANGGLVAAFAGGTVYVKGTAPGTVLQGPIDQRFAQLAGVTGALGFPKTSVVQTPDGRGSYTHFDNGSIYWTQATGAHVVSGPVRDRWAATGWEHGLGYPLADVTATPDGLGAFAHFEKGSIYWTQATGAHVVSGPVKDLWAATGWEHGLGYPLTDVASTPDGLGRYAHFQKGSIYWTQATGAHVVSGPIKDLWAATGWEHGLGYPTTNLLTLPDGAGQLEKFQRGSIYWASGTGAHAVRGAFLTAWGSTGYERGALGYPTRDAYAVTGGSRMDFQHGTITVASSTGRATIVRR